MLIKLRATSIASQFQKLVIVAGGQKGGDLLETEILDLASLEWQLGPSLPKGINNLNLGIVKAQNLTDAIYYFALINTIHVK